MSHLPDPLIENIYEAALDPTRWKPVLEEIRDNLGAHAYSLFSLADAEGQKPELSTSNIDPEWSNAYQEHWWQHDQWVEGALNKGYMNPGETVSGTMLVDPTTFSKGTWFNEALKPQDLGDLLTTTLWSQNNDAQKLVLSFYRSPRDERFGKAEVEQLKALSNHLNRALKLTLSGVRRFDELHQQCSILDGLSQPVLIVDEYRKILSHNERASDLIGNVTCAVLQIRGQRLIDIGQRSTPSLEEAILRARQFEGRPVPLAFIITTERGSLVSGYAHVIKLRQPPTNHLRLEGQHRFMVQLEWTEIPEHESLQPFGKLFGLTPAELRVLSLMMEDHAPRVIAEHLGVSLPTVRTHLQRIRQKTGTRRFADLIRLALATTKRR